MPPRRSPTRCRRRTSASTWQPTARSRSTSASSTPSRGRSRAATARSRSATGETVGSVSVTEGGTTYRPGGCTELGCTDAPGTYGVADVGGRVRIVWHYNALDELRTFQIRYTLRGLAVAYDDVVDVNLKVWGAEWKEPLGRLTGQLEAPGKVERAWGHPVYVRGDVQLTGDRAVLRALDVPAHQFVELRALIPRSAFTSTAGMKVSAGNGLGKIVAAEGADAAAYQRDHDRIEHAKRHPWLYVLYVLLLGLVPGFVVAAAVFLFYGRERRPATTGSTSRSRRPTPRRRSCRRCCARAARRARSSSQRRSST